MTGGCRREDEGLNTAVLTQNEKETMAEGLLSPLVCSSHRQAADGSRQTSIDGDLHVLMVSRLKYPLQ